MWGKTFLSPRRSQWGSASACFRREILGLVCLAVLGCHSETAVLTGQRQNSAEDRLVSIAAVYAQCLAQGKLPETPDDLKAFAKDDASFQEMMRSPNDNEEFVVMWKTNFHQLPPSGSNLPVLAYERKGNAGKRYVIKYPTQVQLLTNEEFRKCQFPPGHTPPAE